MEKRKKVDRSLWAFSDEQMRLIDEAAKEIARAEAEKNRLQAIAEMQSASELYQAATEIDQ